MASRDRVLREKRRQQQIHGGQQCHCQGGDSQEECWCCRLQWQHEPEFLELVQESGLVIEEEVSLEETNCVGELSTTQSELNYSAVLQSVQSTSNSPLPDTPCTSTERTEETPAKNMKRKRDTLNKTNEVMEEALTRLKALKESRQNNESGEETFAKMVGESLSKMKKKTIVCWQSEWKMKFYFWVRLA